MTHELSNIATTAAYHAASKSLDLMMLWKQLFLCQVGINKARSCEGLEIAVEYSMACDRYIHFPSHSSPTRFVSLSGDRFGHRASLHMILKFGAVAGGMYYETCIIQCSR